MPVYQFYNLHRDEVVTMRADELLTALNNGYAAQGIVPLADYPLPPLAELVAIVDAA